MSLAPVMGFLGLNDRGGCRAGAAKPRCHRQSLDWANWLATGQDEKKAEVVCADRPRSYSGGTRR